MNTLSTTITLDSKGENLVSKTVLQDDKHSLCVSVDEKTSDVYLKFTSKQSLYDFAKSLLHEAVFGHTGQMELYPLIHDGKALVVDGVRMTEDSSRLFVVYPENDPD
jgi:hypothetical protein